MRKYYRILLILCLIVAVSPIASHEVSPLLASTDTSNPWLLWFGHFHPALVHFPIALALFAGIAELLFMVSGKPLYENAAKFMLIAGTIMVIPTGLSGLALGDQSHFPTPLSDYYWWHRLFGFLTLIWMLCTCTLYFTVSRRVYRFALLLLVIIVLITAALGGALVWGPESLVPPNMK